jgi:hypothetical protein
MFANPWDMVPLLLYLGKCHRTRKEKFFTSFFLKRKSTRKRQKKDGPSPFVCILLLQIMSAETQVIAPITSVASTNLAIARPANENLTVTIRDRDYDVGKWKYTHPGGHQILEKYRGKDATDVFDAMHGEEAYQRLAKMPSKATPSPYPVEEKQQKFRELRERLVKEGYMDRQPLWYAYKTISSLAIFAAGIYTGLIGHWFISAVLLGTISTWLLFDKCYPHRTYHSDVDFCVVLGIYWQQSGWLAHEYAHHCVFNNRTMNSVVGYFIGNLTMGFSLEWWRQRHNTHHAITNVLESDPDVGMYRILLLVLRFTVTRIH